jgi:hypothetical protein
MSDTVIKYTSEHQEEQTKKKGVFRSWYHTMKELPLDKDNKYNQNNS